MFGYEVMGQALTCGATGSLFEVDYGLRILEVLFGNYCNFVRLFYLFYV
jgi:hypothetical protein